MSAAFTRYRNSLLHAGYAHVLKPIFFLFDPELVHDRMTMIGRILGSTSATRALTRGMFGYADGILHQKVLGMEFANPVGLSAGFDKNAELTGILHSVGFGFAELGSVTGEKCAGNAKPRLWRLPKSKSLLVYYGLKNDGCEEIAHRLEGKHFDMPMGVSVAMTNNQANLDIDSGIRDFAKAFRTMEPAASYITVNVSCPNTQGGQPFIAADKIDKLFGVLDDIETSKPIFIKLSPDLSRDQLDMVLDVAREHRIHGIITTNLTKKREGNALIKDELIPKVGGMSGKPVGTLSDDMLSYIYKREGKRFVLIGSGGVFTAEDAYRKIRLGASLVQMITGMIYEGPQVVSEINRGLAELLRRDGFANVSQAIGADTW